MYSNIAVLLKTIYLELVSALSLVSVPFPTRSTFIYKNLKLLYNNINNGYIPCIQGEM